MSPKFFCNININILTKRAKYLLSVKRLTIKNELNPKHNVDLFLGIGGGPEGVLAASALDTYGCGFQGRFIFDTDVLKKRANKMGINDFDKKYKLDEIIKGDSLFCATGITEGDLVNGVKLRDNKMVVNTLITHKSQNTKKIITGEIDIKK